MSVETLRELAEQKMSSIQIARLMGKTRQQIMNMVRKEGIRLHHGNATTPKKAEIVDFKLPESMLEVKPGAKHILELQAHHCRWPVANGSCGDSISLGSSYCPFHRAISVQ